MKHNMIRFNSRYMIAALLLCGSVHFAQAQKTMEEYEVFPTRLETDIPYRIPAIATASNGDLIAVADYRYCRMDIGFAGTGDGRIDLRASISKDNGHTWEAPFTIVKGKGRGFDVFHTGFGDPCVVADRNSSRVFLLSCAGNVSFPAGTREKHQGIAIMHSEDNGKTWSEPKDIAEDVYAMFDKCSRGPLRAMFIGSGKIHQSRYTKTGKYYRLYCSNLVTDVNGARLNYVLYSDDFGDTWKVLGDKEDVPIINGDEPKVEELPDGRIIISSRCGGGRLFNIFDFENKEKATGKWGKQAFSGAENNGTTAKNNACNGEILVVPAIRTSDNQSTHLVLQSVPFGPGRTNVGIYYKELRDASSCDTPANFAKDWSGNIQATTLPSAYSTMTLQADNTIGFLFEEETHCSSWGGGYTIKYQKYAIEDITGGAYKFDKKNVK